MHDVQTFQNPDTWRNPNQVKNYLNSHLQSRIYEKSRNMVSKEIKKEEIGSEEMPIFERDSAYLEQEIKKEMKIEPNW